MSLSGSVTCVAPMVARASKGEYDDLSGPAIEGFLKEALTSKWAIERRLVEDDRDSIEAALVDLICPRISSLMISNLAGLFVRWDRLNVHKLSISAEFWFVIFPCVSRVKHFAGPNVLVPFQRWVPAGFGFASFC